MLKIYLFAVLFFVPSISYAYLDPGTGNALVFFIITFVGSVLYYLKRFFYKVFFRKNAGESKPTDKQLVIFSEGKSYWYTFKPIIEELIAQNVPFRYLTTDVEDPALDVNSPLMEARFVGSGASAYARIARSRGKLFLVTTPNIGCDGYPLKRPAKIEKMIHVTHSVSDITYYKLGSLDNYDVVMDVGDWCEDSIRKTEKLRNLKKKEFLSVGLPYLDEFAKKALAKKYMSEPYTVLIAPSWGVKGALSVFGTQFVLDILNAGFNVIFRPHPQSWGAEKDLLDSLVEKACSFKNFTLDKNVSNTETMNQSDILISDSSSVRYDFAFLYKKPVITMDVPAADLSSFEASVLGGAWDQNLANDLGVVVKKGEEAELPNTIKKVLTSDFEDTRAKIEKLYDSLIANHGTSAKHVVQWIKDQGL